MASLIEVHESGEIVWTSNDGQLRGWKVQPDGSLVELAPHELATSLSGKADATRHTAMLVDPDRIDGYPTTDIYVRAQLPDTGRWASVDIAELDARSLLTWLRSRGGHNPWAEDVVLGLLGHSEYVRDLEGDDD